VRLWHEALIPQLPRQQLLGQWRECIALLGNGWGKKHKTVDYVFTYSDKKLLRYAGLVYDEMIKRGYSPDYKRVIYALSRRYNYEITEANSLLHALDNETPYSEHNEEYLQECLLNLNTKGIKI
jgi:uncharacterized protein (TIGR02328 family)